MGSGDAASTKRCVTYYCIHHRGKLPAGYEIVLVLVLVLENVIAN